MNALGTGQRFEWWRGVKQYVQSKREERTNGLGTGERFRRRRGVKHWVQSATYNVLLHSSPPSKAFACPKPIRSFLPSALNILLHSSPPSKALACPKPIHSFLPSALPLCTQCFTPLCLPKRSPVPSPFVRSSLLL